jgi:hypothetical protein
MIMGSVIGNMADDSGTLEIIEAESSDKAQNLK